MHDIKKYIEQIQEIANRLPLGKKEVYQQLGIGNTHWYRLRRMGDRACHPKTIRAMKAFIDKYKDVK